MRLALMLVVVSQQREGKLWSIWVGWWSERLALMAVGSEQKEETLTVIYLGGDGGQRDWH